MRLNSPSASAKKRSGARSNLRGAVAGVIRSAILDAAETVFGERGFTEAKMAEVAERAGVAAGTLYNYFDSKESIFRALIEHRAEEFMGALEAIAGERGEPRASIVRITEATFHYVESHAAMFKLFEQLGCPSGAEARRGGPSYDRMRVRYLQVFRSALARAVQAGLVRPELPLHDLSVIYAGSVHGLLRAWLLEGRKRQLRGRASLLVNLFFDGAGAKT
jgi:AcrR family transcriptional regulator